MAKSRWTYTLNPVVAFLLAALLSFVRRFGPLVAVWLSITVAIGPPALAEDAPRRVGSLNYISGEVSYNLRTEPGEPHGSGTEDWLQADFDQPVCQDMSLKTGRSARARITIGRDAIQMAADTAVNILNLSDQLIEASISYGRIYLQLSRLGSDESVELETPRGSLWLLQPGAYDIETGAGEEPMRIIVFEGKARFLGGAADLPIAAGKEVQVTGAYPSVAASESDWTGINPARPAPAAEPDAGAAGAASVPPSNPALALAGSPPPIQSASATPGSSQKSSDEFLTWVEESDQDQGPPQTTSHQSSRYVSAETTGAAALDRYGRWDTLPDAQAVWFPTAVPDDWAPYRFGHWDWIEPWGWTWIDDQPWGFAPFHYGRWVKIDGHWGWVPGPVDPDPVYAPALVAFVDASDGPGGPGGPGGPDGGPPVGWFPLGPGDDYTPWYPASAVYVESINTAEHRYFHDLHHREFAEREAWRAQYFNRRFATVVSRDAFASERRIDRGMMQPVAADRLEHAAVMRGAPSITPVAMRAAPGAGEFRGGVRGTPAVANSGGLREQPGGAAGQHELGLARHEGPPATEHGGRAPQGLGRGEAERGLAAPTRAGAGQFGHAEIGRSGAAAGAFGGAAQHYARPEMSPAATAGYRAAAPQFGQPATSQGFRGAASQFGQPTTSQGFRGAAPQFGQRQVAQGFRGVPQFGRPQAFQTPAASARAGGIFGRATAQPAARLGGGAAAAVRHK